MPKDANEIFNKYLTGRGHVWCTKTCWNFVENISWRDWFKMVKRALICSCKSTKITTSYWTTINRRMLEPIKKRYSMSKDKEELWDGRRGAITMTSNPIPIGWATHKLENNNTKEVLPLLWRFWTPRQASQPGNPAKGLGIQQKDWESSKRTRNPQGIWLWKPVGWNKVFFKEGDWLS